ncbi:O-antigen ligase family protein [Rathayibacter rathayi]|uniref:O-antigen ligase-related domain-containing protein n=2 Tax=Rathayibacter rathayi TaxID=33887 RepID=A0ABD6WCF8_RATRA|nr:oligosaccharide repeat unit polymerase [Rathayibacter rathayi]PPF16339.1 hypothetical protein C5C04_00725 [Rathayibacter rathayi]
MLIVAAALALLFLVVTFPRRAVGLRGYAVGLSIFVLGIGASTSAPEAIRYASTGIAAVFLILAWAFSERTRPRKRSRLVLLAWFVWTTGVSLLISSSPPAAVLALIVVPLLLFPVVSRLGEQDLVPLLRWTALTVLVQVAVGIAELTVLAEPIWGYRNLTTAGLPVIRYNPFLPGLIRIQGTTGHPIIFSLIVMFSFFLILALGSKLSRTVRLLSLGTAIVGLLLSGTRSAFVAAAVGFVVYLFFAPTTGTRVKNVLIIIGAGVAIFLGDFGLSTVATQAATSDSFGHRLEGWANADQLLHRGSPTGAIGSGFFSELSIFAQGLLQRDGFLVIDNHFIWTLAISGGIGLALMVLAMGGAWVDSDRLGRAQVAVLLAMAFSFDLMTWVVSVSIFVISLTLPPDLIALARSAPSREAEPPPDLAGRAEASARRGPHLHEDPPPSRAVTARHSRTRPDQA